MDFKDLIQYGLPTVLLAFLCYGLWRIVVWIGANVVLPARDRLFAHLDHVDQTMSNLAESIKSLRGLLDGSRCRLPESAVCIPGNGPLTAIQALPPKHPP